MFILNCILLYAFVELCINQLIRRINITNIYTQQDATLHSLFYPETALHVSGGTTTHNLERK